MATGTKFTEIEIDSPQNRAHFFPPLQRRLRGRLDFRRDSEPEAVRKLRDWEGGLPGQVVGVDPTTGDAYVRETLHDEPRAKEKVESRGVQIAARRDLQRGVDVSTWLYWMRRAVDAGHARVVKGTLPPLDRIPGNPVKNFHPKPQTLADRRIDRLLDALEALTKR